MFQFFVIRLSAWVEDGGRLPVITPFLNYLSPSVRHNLQPIGHQIQARSSSASVQADRAGADAAKCIAPVNSFLMLIAFNATKRDALTSNITPCRDHVNSLWSRSKNTVTINTQKNVAAADVRALRMIELLSSQYRRTKIAGDIIWFPGWSVCELYFVHSQWN